MQGGGWGAWLTARATSLLLGFEKFCVGRAKLMWKSTVHPCMLLPERILSEIRLTATRAPVAPCETGRRALTCQRAARSFTDLGVKPFGAVLP